MDTILKKIDNNNPHTDIATFLKVADILKSDGLVAFPTETVYGLGSNALSPAAVKKIYKAKGRPSDNPLIVHISSIDELKPLVLNISDKAKLLMAKFWPGALTLIFKKSNLIPYETSGGLETVAIRLPSNPIARFLISTTGLPIAAPSANSSGKPSPTKAIHVLEDLNGKIDAILDGGDCNLGLESTILDVSTDDIYILRPGPITISMIENEIGKIKIDPSIISTSLSSSEPTGAPKAPGMKYTHYSPNANITIVSGSDFNVQCEIKKLADSFIKKQIKTCIITTKQNNSIYNNYDTIIVGDLENPKTIAKNLFSTFRKCDELHFKEVLIGSFDENDLGLAIMNRLKKASGYTIINV